MGTKAGPSSASSPSRAEYVGSRGYDLTQAVPLTSGATVSPQCYDRKGNHPRNRSFVAYTPERTRGIRQRCFGTVLHLLEDPADHVQWACIVRWTTQPPSVFDNGIPNPRRALSFFTSEPPPGDHSHEWIEIADIEGTIGLSAAYTFSGRRRQLQGWYITDKYGLAELESNTPL